MNLYEQNGYSSRKNYLSQLAEDFNVPISTVAEIADLLGPEEDFDGLIAALEDYNDFRFGELG